MSRESEEVGRCEGCGRFKRWSDMGHMNPDGSLILCGDCSARHQKYPGPYSSRAPGGWEVVCAPR